MRFVTRTLAFVLVILAAFWFTAENADERVLMDFAFFRVRASLPLVIFGSILLGMGASVLTGWRASRRERLRRSAWAEKRSGGPDSVGRPLEGADAGDLDQRERASLP